MGSYLYIFGTIFFTVYGQIVLKWRLTNLHVVLPEGLLNKGIYLTKLIFDPSPLYKLLYLILEPSNLTFTSLILLTISI